MVILKIIGIHDNACALIHQLLKGIQLRYIAGIDDQPVIPCRAYLLQTFKALGVIPVCIE